MAANQSATVSVKIQVDVVKSRVVYAEAGNDFVDILFSFLTLPMGTIVRLMERSKIGCLSKLYRSVRKLRKSCFWTNACKKMLLHPRNPCEAFCRDLKVNVDDTEPTKYFMCPTCFGSGSSLLLSNYANARCPGCENLMNREVIESDSSSGSSEVFVKGSTNYIVSDDLKVITPYKLGAVVELLGNAGIQYPNALEERIVEVGLTEILNLLERSLLSKCPLTDVFLPNQRSNSSHQFLSEQVTNTPKKNWGMVVDNLVMMADQVISELVINQSMGVEILVRKSNGKALYAEAREDFVDLLLSFLTIPVANMVKRLAGNSSLGCIDNLYSSVQHLDDEWFVTHQEPRRVHTSISSKKLLLGPGLAQKFSCSNRPFYLCDETCVYPNLRIKRTGDVCSLAFGCDADGIETHNVSLIDPKSPRGEESFTGFMTRPAVFLVSDCLAVQRLSGTTSIETLLRELQVPINDIQRHPIQINKQQFLNLLKASLISTSALNALNPLAKT